MAGHPCAHAQGYKSENAPEQVALHLKPAGTSPVEAAMAPPLTFNASLQSEDGNENARETLVDRSRRARSVLSVQPVRPFLKWAGAKTRLVAAIRDAASAEPRRLIEPFVGSGAVVLNLACQTNLLADSNRDLIDVYAELQRDGERFIRDCEALFTPENNCAAAYYALRREFNEARNRRRKACLFVYLNRHGYNGLCRYNARGGFNVPFGRYPSPRLRRAAMQTFHALLQKCTLRCDDFRSVLAEAAEGDLVYCDPPYVPASATANFTGYAKGGFGARDQADLAERCRQAARRGATVIVSNHDTAETRALYREADALHELSVPRRISCNAAKREPARELLVVFRPEQVATAV